MLVLKTFDESIMPLRIKIRIKNGFIILQYIIIYSKGFFFQSFSYDYCYFQQVYKMLL